MPKRGIKYHIHKHIKDSSPAFRHQVAIIMDECGPDFAKKILWKTLRLEAKGGVLTVDGSRRRTPGGLYLYLAMQQMTPEQRKTINYYKRRLKAIGKKAFEQEVLIPNKNARIAKHNAMVAADQAAKAERLAREAAERAEAEAKAKAESAKKAHKKVKRNSKPTYVKPVLSLANRLADLESKLPATALPPDLPPSVAAKAGQAWNAAEALRARVAELEAKPPGQQTGLEMARKLLAKAEAQLAALLAPYTDANTPPDEAAS